MQSIGSGKISSIICYFIILDIGEKGWAAATVEYRHQNSTIVLKKLLKGIIHGSSVSKKNGIGIEKIG